MIHVYRWTESDVEALGGDYAASVPVAEGSWLWVDVVEKRPETVRDVGNTLGLDPGAIEEAIATTSLPLIEEHANSIFVVLHGFSTGSGTRLSTPEIDVFIGERYLVTFRDGATPAIDSAHERLAEEGYLPVASPAALLSYFALAAGRRYQPLIQELERQVDNLEEMAIRGDPQTVVEVHALRRDVIYLRRALAPQFDVYEDLSESTHHVLDDVARVTFNRVANVHRRALEALETGRALLGSVLETYRGALADQTNEIMRVLTVFSAILLPLALIAGLWGMNFARIPGADEASGFWILLGTMALLATGVWVYFARRGFIGAPRLRDLPKAVGLGIFNIGTAPIRVVAGGIKQLGRSGDGSE